MTPKPVQAWRRSTGGLAILCKRSIAAITVRFQWLESAVFKPEFMQALISPGKNNGVWRAGRG